MTLAQTSRLMRSPNTVSILILVLISGAVTLGEPLIRAYFPDYIPGYLIQIPAAAALIFFWRFFDVGGADSNWPQRGLLFLAFLIPLANTFFLKVLRKVAFDHHILLEMFRPAIILLIVLAGYVLLQRKRSNIPAVLHVAFWIGLIGWMGCVASSDYPFISLGTGFFEFAAFWLALYAFAVIAPDRKFLVRCIVLFVVSTVLVALAQTIAIVFDPSVHTLAGVPLFADEFLEFKKQLPLMIAAGGNGYGNTDNFASLWCFAVPLLAGLAYVSDRWKKVAWAGFAVFLYAGLLIYSRAAIATVVIALIGLWVYRVLAWKATSAGLALSLFLIFAIHANPTVIGYYTGGVQSFVASFMTSDQPAIQVGGNAEVTAEKKEILLPNDVSGVDRAEAWRRGIFISLQSWPYGVGYGAYHIFEPIFTAPHSMVLERIAEGGVLSLVSFIILALYAPFRLLAMLWRREQDMLTVTCLTAASAFFLKASIFGASFAINGLIVWGFGIALLLATSIIPASDAT